MSKTTEKEGLELTFHSCLLQVLQSRTENLSDIPKFYVQSVKQKVNQFKDEIDKKLDRIYGTCDREELDQGQTLIDLISDKLDEAWNEYQLGTKSKERHEE